MDRRETLLALVALGATPLTTLAQQAGKVWRIGYLSGSTPSAGVLLPSDLRDALHADEVIR